MRESPIQDSPGHIIAPAYVTEAVSAADDLARSRSELRVVGLLKGFLEDKIQNNISRQVLVLEAQNSWRTKHFDVYESESDESRHQMLDALALLALSTPPALEMDARAGACVGALGRTIRSGLATKPPQCSKVVIGDIDFDKAEDDLERAIAQTADKAKHGMNSTTPSEH